MMHIRNVRPGQIVKVNAFGSPSMVVVNTYFENGSVDCRYWNPKKGGFEDIALKAHEIEIEKDFDPDKMYKPSYGMGERVEFKAYRSIKMVVFFINAEIEDYYSCRYFNPETGTFLEENFYGYELNKINRASNASILSVFP